MSAAAKNVLAVLVIAAAIGAVVVFAMRGADDVNESKDEMRGQTVEQLSD